MRLGRAHPTRLAGLLLALCALATPVHADPLTEWTEVQQQAAKLYSQGDYPKASASAEEALRLARQVGLKDPRVAESLELLGDIAGSQSYFAKAQTLYQDALAIREAAYKPTHPFVERSIKKLAELEMLQGRYAQAQPLYERILSIREQTLGRKHSMVADTLVMLATVAIHRQHYPEAKALRERAVAILEDALDPHSPIIASAEIMLANAYASEGQLADAEAMARHALTIREKAYGADHAQVAEVVKLLADYAAQRGQSARAIVLNQRLLAMQEKLAGLHHLSVADTLMRLVELWMAQQDYAQAQSACERAIGIRRRTLGPDDPSVAQAETILAKLYEAQGDTEKAAVLTKRLGAASRPLLARGADADLKSRAGMERADLHVLDGVDRIAKPQTEHRNFELLAASFANRGQIYEALGDYSEAESLFHQSLVIYDKILGEGYDEVSVVLEHYANVLTHLGRADEAEQLQSRATALQARRAKEASP